MGVDPNIYYSLSGILSISFIETLAIGGNFMALSQ